MKQSGKDFVFTAFIFHLLSKQNKKRYDNQIVPFYCVVISR